MILAVILPLIVTIPIAWLLFSPGTGEWTEAETEILRSLWIGSLKTLPPDPTNSVSDDPRAARLGHQLFFDKRMSGNGQISCSTCHKPDQGFADGLMKGRAIGESDRNTPGLIGVAFSPWLYWDGRKDSLWSQAISPLENPEEHGGNRMQYMHLIAADPEYKKAYEEIFGMLPNLSDRTRFPENAGPVAYSPWNAAWLAMTEEDQDIANRFYSNIGKLIAAYVRVLVPGASRFDAYVDAVISGDEVAQEQSLSSDEVNGLRLFLGEGNCTQCHNGPLLTNHEFHNTGVISFPGDVPDKGRIEGVRSVQQDPFYCLGTYSDGSYEDCAELRFVRTGAELIGAFRTPSLRNLGSTAPFMHKGQLADIPAVLEHYNRAELAMIGHNEVVPLRLSRRELRQLEMFLGALTAPPATARKWLQPPVPVPLTNR